MKNVFSEFYVLSGEEFSSLWEDGLIVLDTNVLLDLYRTPPDARDQFLSVLGKVKDRLWIPFQVGLEFHRNRPKVINDKARNISDILSDATKSFSAIKEKITSLDIDKYGIDLESAPLLSEIDNVRSKLSEAIGKIHSSQAELSKSDPIQERLFDFYTDRVGNGPGDQNQLSELVKDGEKRYIEKIPPGYDDQGKSKNPNDAFFYHNGIKYERRFGDLIFWRQLINHVKSTDIKKVILVSSEKKEDWWRIEDGKRIGPQPELIQEIKRESGVQLFWMYPPDQFMKYAAQQAKVDVSEEALAEVRNAGNSSSQRQGEAESSSISIAHESDLADFESAISSANSNKKNFASDAKRAVNEWLCGFFGQTEKTVFPDLLAEISGKRIGFEVVPTDDLTRHSLNRTIKNSFGFVDDFIDEGEVDALYLIVVASQSSYIERYRNVDREIRKTLIKALLRAAIKDININGIYFGILIHGTFFPVAFSKGIKGDISQNLVPNEFSLS